MTSRSWIVAVVLVLAAGPASAATVVWGDDVEAGAGGWTATGLWHRVATGEACANAHGGSASWYYGLAATCTFDTGATNSGTLTSPAFVVPHGNTTLGFWSYYETEETGTSYDRRIVQVSVDGGPFADVLQLSGDTMLSWRRVQVDLSAYAGHTLQLRFSFGTIDDILNGYRGWYLDDLGVFTFVPQYLPGSATSSWIDIASPGNNTGINCDDCEATRPIGFPFNFYGTTYANVNVSSNGYVTFAGSASAYSNRDIPNVGTPNAFAAPFWDDLFVTGAARVYTATVGTAPNRKFVATWQAVDYCCTVGSGPVTFQLVLSETDNTITFQYADLSSPSNPQRGLGNSATVGLENQAGTSGFRHSFNQAVLSNGLALQLLLDRDGDGVSDVEEGVVGTDPDVNDAPSVLITLSGPGTTHGTAFYQFAAVGDLASATSFRVFYGPTPGATLADYPAHFDTTDLTARAGYIDQQWGMQGVPMVFFRIAPVRVLAGRTFLGGLSNEHAAYFAGAAPKETSGAVGGVTTTTSGSYKLGCSSGGAGALGLLLVAAVGLRAQRRRARGV